MSQPSRIEDVPLFREFSPPHLEQLRRAATRQMFKAGEIVFEHGDPPESLYIVEEGVIDIVLPSRAEEIILATFGPGSFFGELAVFDNHARVATARAATDAALLCIPLRTIAALLEAHPAAARHFMGTIIQRLRGADEMLSRLQIKNVNEIADERMTVGERIADRVAQFGGSWTFILCFTAFLLAWMIANSALVLLHPPDPYPYIFLNLILSCLAALQAPIIMMSQNRQAAKDRLRADQDYQINVKAEFAIQQLHRKVDELRTMLQQSQRRA